MNELLSASYVSSFDISRTGDSIVYARNSRDGRSLHLLLRNTSATYDDHTVAAEDGTYESLMLTGDGRKLIYLRDNNGDEKFDIFMCSIEECGNSFRLTDKINLTPDTDFSILRGISQDEAGRRIAFVSNRDGNFASYFLGTTDGKTKRISTHGYSDDAAVISPDGKKVAVSYGRYGQDGAITVYSTGDDSDSMELLHEGQPVDAGSPCRLGDSRHIAFSSNSGEFGRIGIMDTADGSLNWVSGTDEDLSHPVVATLSGVIACLREGGTDRVPAVLVPGLTNNTVSPDNLQGLCFDIRIDAGGKSLFMLMETASEPANLCMVETGSGKHYRLSHSFPHGSIAATFINARAVSYMSEFDGMMIPALIYVPEHAEQRGPAVVSIHGGPTWKSYNGWQPLIQGLVSCGVTVLCQNYRGSSGYGRSFRDANRFLMGMADLADCASAWKYLVDSGLAGERRVAVAGDSFGGYH